MGSAAGWETGLTGWGAGVGLTLSISFLLTAWRRAGSEAGIGTSDPSPQCRPGDLPSAPAPVVGEGPHRTQRADPVSSSLAEMGKEEKDVMQIHTFVTHGDEGRNGSYC